MGTVSALSETLFGRTRGAMLAVLYGHVGESFYLRQLSRMTEIALGPVQREIRQLHDAGLVTKTKLGTSILYTANTASPVFQEMRDLVTKTVGIHDLLLTALLPFANQINLAFVYGSVARSRDNSSSDVDLMIVGTVNFADIVNHLESARKQLNREINPTVYTVEEFKNKVRGSFLKNVLGEKMLFLIGDEIVFRGLAEKSLA